MEEETCIHKGNHYRILLAVLLGTCDEIFEFGFGLIVGDVPELIGGAVVVVFELVDHCSLAGSSKVKNDDFGVGLLEERT